MTRVGRRLGGCELVQRGLAAAAEGDRGDGDDTRKAAQEHGFESRSKPQARTIQRGLRGARGSRLWSRRTEWHSAGWGRLASGGRNIDATPVDAMTERLSSRSRW